MVHKRIIKSIKLNLTLNNMIPYQYFNSYISNHLVLLLFFICITIISSSIKQIV